MRQINAWDFSHDLDQYFELVKDEPIVIAKAGKPLAVLVSIHEFELLQRMEQLYLIARGCSLEATGECIGHEEAVKLLLYLGRKLGPTI